MHRNAPYDAHNAFQSTAYDTHHTFDRTGNMLTIAGHTLSSRLLMGTGKFASPEQMMAALDAAQAGMVTLAMKRVTLDAREGDVYAPLRTSGVPLLPNTSGARTADEAVLAAQLAREALGTAWIKLEIHPDQRWLLPDPVETLRAAEQLVTDGFIVLPYCSADPVLCKRLEEAGCAAVMPLGAPIGSNQGLSTREMLRIIIEQSQVPVIVDAGLGRPSQATDALEMGADAVLVNTAIASAADCVSMAHAFRLAVEAGALARRSCPGATAWHAAQASSPLTAFLDLDC